MRATVLSLALACWLLCGAGSALAGDPPPTPDELARMILEGNDAEQALVAAWLEGADRTELRAVFASLRARRAAARSRPVTLAPAAPQTGPLVNLEVRVLDASPQFVRDLGVDLSAASGTSIVYLDETQSSLVLRAAGKSAGVHQVSAPRITLYDHQQGNVSVTNKVSYVQDYDVEVKGDQAIANPVVATMKEGLQLDVRPTVSSDRKHVTLELDSTSTVIDRPIPKKKVLLSIPHKQLPPGEAGREVTIQVPVQHVVHTRTTLRLPSGGWVLLVPGLATHGDKGAGTRRLLLVRAQVVSLPR
jgi:Flp pilus assembly secretin CpaC